jgi:sugar (pentulose or hexulose) kinase
LSENRKRLRSFLELLNETLGIGTQEIVLSGGVSKSSIWRQIRSDATRRVFVLPRVQDATSLGSALLAGAGVGVYRSIDDAAKAVVYEAKVLPREQSSVMYDRKYKTYKQLRGMLDKF